MVFSPNLGREKRENHETNREHANGKPFVCPTMAKHKGCDRPLQVPASGVSRSPVAEMQEAEEKVVRLLPEWKTWYLKQLILEHCPLSPLKYPIKIFVLLPPRKVDTLKSFLLECPPSTPSPLPPFSSPCVSAASATVSLLIPSFARGSGRARMP